MLRFAVAALSLKAAASIRIDTTDGGYEDAKVSISKDAPFNESIIDNIKIPLHIMEECLKMLRLVVAALVIAAVGTIPIDTTDGGYEGVTVSIHHSVPFNEAIVENLKVLFGAASKFLHQATNGAVYFKLVMIEFPLSWPKRRSPRALSSNSFERSDVRINLPAKTTGDVPSTQQPRECGEPGDFVQLTPGFLVRTQNMRASGPDFTGSPFAPLNALLKGK